MKTLAQSILSALFVLAISSATAYGADEKVSKVFSGTTVQNCTVAATTTFQSNVFQNANGRVSVIVMKDDLQPITIQVVDNEHHVLFSKIIQEDSIRQNLRMNELDPGMYQVMITKNGECFTKTVTVK